MNQDVANDVEKRGYVCGPLTELPKEQQQSVKNFYSDVADACEAETGIRAFVPHEHFDPIRHASFLPYQIDRFERKQVCERTSVLIVVAIAPSWGGGIEVEMANQSGVSVIVMYPEQKKVSRLLLGNPAVGLNIITYRTKEDALRKLRGKLTALRQAKLIA